MSNRNKLPTALSLVLALSLVGIIGCSTFYYKQFVIRGTPRYSDAFIAFKEFTCSVHIEIQPSDEKSYRDSTYQVWLSIFRKATESCTDRHREIFETLELSEFTLAYDGLSNNIRIGVQSQEREPERCYVELLCNPLTIDDSVDSLSVRLAISYRVGESTAVADTTVSLFRLTGKEKEFDDF